MVSRFGGIPALNDKWIVPSSKLGNVAMHLPFSPLGVVHKLRIQEEGGRWSKNVEFLSILVYTTRNVNGGWWWSKKTYFVNDPPQA